MKKIIIVISVIVMMGCNLNDIANDINYKENLNKCDVYYGEFGDINNLDEICLFVIGNIEYKKGDPLFWDTPKDTIDSGYGDCKNYTKVFLNILYVTTGQKGNAILVDNSRAVVNGGDVDHVIAELEDGTQIDPQNGDIVNYDIGYRYMFDEMFY